MESDHKEMLIKEWETDQDVMRQQVITYDTEKWQKSRTIATNTSDAEPDALQYVAGCDISTVKLSDTENCIAAVGLVVCKFPSLEVVYQKCDIVKIAIPYVPGLLSFREGPYVVEAFEKFKRDQQNIIPQVILIDGNGILHPRKCGLACYVGTKLDLPCIGVAKNLYHVDGIAKDDNHKEKIQSLSAKGEQFPLISDSGNVMGMALKTSDHTLKPVFVSIGHKISLETANWVVLQCCRYRVPEPTRQADIVSREILRKLYPDDHISDDGT